MIANLILAQAAPSGHEWRDFFTVAGWIFGALGGIGAFLVLFIRDRKRDVGPQPFIVAMQKEFATQHEFQRHVDENRKQHESFDVRLGGVDRKGKERTDEKVAAAELKREESSRRMHNEVNDLRVKFSALETETKNQTAQLARMDRKLDDLISRKSL